MGPHNELEWNACPLLLYSNKVGGSPWGFSKRNKKEPAAGTALTKPDAAAGGMECKTYPPNVCPVVERTMINAAPCLTVRCAHTANSTRAHLPDTSLMEGGGAAAVPAPRIR